MRRIVFFAMAALLATVALVGRVDAVYNANISGQLAGFWSYTEHDAIYFYLKNQPTTHPTCNPSFFVVDATIPADRRKLIFARLALAYATQENLNIGYDNTSDCAQGYIRVHRVG